MVGTTRFLVDKTVFIGRHNSTPQKFNLIKNSTNKTTKIQPIKQHVLGNFQIIGINYVNAINIYYKRILFAHNFDGGPLKTFF